MSICEPADINGTGSKVVIGDGCDLAAFVTVNVADSHRSCIGLEDEIERREIVLGNFVFVGQGATILGGCNVGHHSVIGAGVVLKGVTLPPYSRVHLPTPIIEPGYYDRDSA